MKGSLMTEIDQLKVDVGQLLHAQEHHEQLHKVQTERISNLEKVAEALVKWHSSEGFTVEGLLHRG